MLVVVCFALGLLAKPMLVTLPFVLLLLDYWPLGRLTSDGAVRRNRADLTWSSAHMSVALQLLREKLPLFALALASSVVTFLVQLHGGAVRDLDRFPFDRRLANALVSYADYIGMTLWPARLGVFYPFPTSLPAWRVIAAAVILIAVSAVALRAARRHPYLLVGWFWYLGTLVPVIGLVQVGAQSMADRYTYVPLIGLFLVVAWGVPDLLAGWRHRRIALAAAAGIVVTACAVTARAQVRTWEDTVVLWQHVVEVTSGNSIAHRHLGDVLASQGKLDEAIAHYREVVRLRPRYVAGILSLANALTRAGRIDEAVTQYSEALRLTPDSAGAHNNLGVALTRQGRDSEAMAHFAEAARLSPQFADAHRNLAMAMGKQGRLDEAIPEMLDAMRLRPNQAQWHHDLALLYQWQGNTELARQYLERSLTLDPTNLTARRALKDLKMRGRQ
jgi:Flp pilus assembly protein TadD